MSNRRIRWSAVYFRRWPGVAALAGELNGCNDLDKCDRKECRLKMQEFRFALYEAYAAGQLAAGDEAGAEETRRQAFRDKFPETEYYD